MLIDLFNRACNCETEEEFNLTSEEIRKLASIDDIEISQVLLWLRNKGAAKLSLEDTEKDETISWINFRLKKDVNVRSSLYHFIIFLQYRNPFLQKPLSKLLGRI